MSRLQGVLPAYLLVAPLNCRLPLSLMEDILTKMEDSDKMLSDREEPDEGLEVSSPEYWRRQVGVRLRRLRGNRSQPAFAAELGKVWGKPIHASQISDWESGRKWIRAAIMDAAEALACNQTAGAEDDLDRVRRDLALAERRLGEVSQRVEQLESQQDRYKAVVEALRSLPPVRNG
jgi:hypothetical protein